MWPFIKINPIGVIIVCLLFFSLYLIYSANSATNNFMKNYEEQNLMSNYYRKKWLPDEDNEMIPALNHKSNSILNDEIIKREFRLFEMVNLVELLNVAIQVAENGGRQVRIVREMTKFKQKDKGLNDPLTEGDIRSHQVMVGQLSASFPGLNIISEETNNKMKDVKQVKYNLVNKAKLIDQLKNIQVNRLVALSELTIWIDPLDATQEYTENLIKYVTTMVCVAYKGKPIIGVIHRPFKNMKLNVNHSNLDYETYWAWNNVAMSKNIENMISKRKKEIIHQDNLKVIVSRSHSNGTVESLSQNLFGKNTKIITAGGSGYKSIELIRGNADIYLHNSLIKKWDICAPNAIFNSISQKINANFTTLKGESIKYTDEDVKNHGGVLASVGFDHEKIVNDLKRFI